MSEEREPEITLSPNVAFLDEGEPEDQVVEETEGGEEEQPEELRVVELQERLRQAEAKASRLGAKAEKLQIVEQRLEQMLPVIEQLKQQQEQAQKPAEPEGPDPEEDPIAYAAWEAKKTREEVNKFTQSQQQQAQVFQQQEQLNQALAFADESARRFQQEHPDYIDAAQHYMEHQTRSFRAMGYTDQEAEQRMVALRNVMIMSALQSGDDPASVLYERAQVLGYEPKPATKATKATEAVDEEAAPAPSTASRAEKIERSQSLGSVGGGASPDGGTDAKQWFTQLSDEEYRAFFNKAVKATGMDPDQLDRMIEEGNVSLRQLGLK